MGNKVLEYLEQNKMNLAVTLSELIQIDSQNPREDGTTDESAAQEYVENMMNELGMAPRKLVYDAEKKRPNVYGIYSGKGGGRSLLLNGHIDTVSVTNPSAWSYPPLGGIIRDGKVLGRGASDDKMAVTAMLWAVKAISECGIDLKGDVMLLSSVGEESAEGGTLGAGRAVRDMPKPDFAIVSEATCMDMDIESSSVCVFEITVTGKAAHTCAHNQIYYPQRPGLPCGNEAGVNAFDKALLLVDTFKRLEKDWLVNRRYDVWGAGGSPVSDGKGLGGYCFTPTLISGGDYFLSVMDKVKLTYCITAPPDRPLEDTMEEIKAVIHAVCSTDSWLKDHPPVIETKILFPGFKTRKDHPGVCALQNAFRNVLGREVSLTANKSVMDTTFIHQEGVTVVALGPGGPESNQHGIDEWASIDEVLKATKVYAQMILDWCEVL